MAIKSYHTGSLIPAGPLRVLFYGDPNIGKTTLALSCARPLLIDFDGGAHRAETTSNGGLILRVETWSDVQQILHDQALLANHDTLILDTITSCIDLMIVDMIRLNAKMGNGKGSPSQQGWIALGNDFKGLMRQIAATGKDLVMLCHAVEVNEGDNIRKRPKAQGQAKGLIVEHADYVAYLHSVNNRRTASFTFTDDHFAKDVKGIMGEVELESIRTTPTLGADMISRMRSVFAQVQSERSAEQETVQTWADTIATWTTVDEFNQAIASIRQLPQHLQVQVGHHMKRRRSELGIIYDQSSGSFVRPEPAAEAFKAPEAATTMAAPTPAAPAAPTPPPAPVTVPPPPPLQAAKAAAKATPTLEF